MHVLVFHFEEKEKGNQIITKFQTYATIWVPALSGWDNKTQQWSQEWDQ